MCVFALFFYGVFVGELKTCRLQSTVVVINGYFHSIFKESVINISCTVNKVEFVLFKWPYIPIIVFLIAFLG